MYSTVGGAFAKSFLTTIPFASYSSIFLYPHHRIVPLGRMAEPEEAANLVASLVPSEAKYIAGTNCSVDGGAQPTI